MSTRCQIGFYESADQPLDAPTALIYRHCDGYLKDRLACCHAPSLGRRLRQRARLRRCRICCGTRAGGAHPRR